MALYQVPPLPNNLGGFPNTNWGIAYDIDIPATQSDLPNGWASRRARTYDQLVARLRGALYLQSQYSDYLREDTDAVTTWANMFDLMNIMPPGKMETTIKRLKMYTVQHLHLQDVSEEVQLGGMFSLNLRGLTPRGLVEHVAELLDPPPQDVINLVVPAHTAHTDEALVPGNWWT